LVCNAITRTPAFVRAHLQQLSLDQRPEMLRYSFFVDASSYLARTN